MDTINLSEKYYKIGTRNEPCEASKIMTISVIVFVCSIVNLAIVLSGFFSFLPAEILGVVSLFSIISCFVSYLFSFIMIFISKMPNKNLFINLICYLLLAISLIFTLTLGVKLLINLDAVVQGNPNGITEEALSSVLSSFGIKLIIVYVFELYFNLSMLISFELKELKCNALALIFFIVYLLLQAVNLIMHISGVAVPIWWTLVSGALWIISLYFILENRMVKVECVVYKDDNKEIEGDDKSFNEQDLALLERKKKRNKFIIKLLQIAFVSIVPIFLLIYCDNNLFNHGQAVWGGFIVTAFALVGFGVSAFFLTSKGKYDSFDIITCICFSVGLILLTLNYALIRSVSDVFHVILGIISILVTAYGSFRYFFVTEFGERKILWLRITAFACSSIMQLWYVLCLFFADILTEQLTYITPGAFYASLIAFLVPYVMHAVTSVRLHDKKQKELN